MSRFILVLFVASALPASLAGQQKTEAPKSVPATDSAARLPVKRVVLYKNGVGYFEHSAHVRAAIRNSISISPAASSMTC